jgi:hypothetical protein
MISCFTVGYQFEILLSGRHPTKGFKGAPLTTMQHEKKGQWFAGGYRFAFLGLQLDTKEKVAQHHFKRNWQSNFLCEHCFGHAKDQFANAYSFGDDARWSNSSTWIT